MTARTSFFARHAHRRMRRPAYLRPSSPRGRARAAGRRRRARGTRPAGRRSRARRAAARPRRRRPSAAPRPPLVEPRARAREQAADRHVGRAPRTAAPREQPGPAVVAALGQRAGEQQRAEHRRRQRPSRPRTARSVRARTFGHVRKPRRARARASEEAGRLEEVRSRVPSKSTPMSPRASAPASSGGRNGRTPLAPARPAPWPMSRTRLDGGSRGSVR